MPSCSRPQVLPALIERTESSRTKTQTFAELLIDCKETGLSGRCSSGCCGKAAKVGQRWPWEMGGSAFMGSAGCRGTPPFACGRPEKGMPWRDLGVGRQASEPGMQVVRVHASPSRPASLLVSLLQHAVARCSVDVDR